MKISGRISQAVNRLVAYLLPAHRLENEEDAQLLRLLVPICLFALVIVCAYACIWLVIMPARSERIALPGIVVVAALLALGLIRLERVRLALHVLLVSVWITVTLTILSAGGTRAPAFSAYTVIVMTAGLLAGWRLALIYAVGAVLVGLVMVLADPTGTTMLQFATPLSAWLTHAAVMLMIAGISYASVRRWRRTLADSRAALAALEATQQELRESEKRYRVVSELISDYAYAYDIHPDGSFTPVWITDESFQRMTGYHWQDIGASLKLYHPDDTDTAHEHVSQTVRGMGQSGEYRILTRAGETRWLSIKREVEFDAADGRPVRYYGAAQDITERKLDRAALVELATELDNRATHLATLYEIAHDISTVSDLITTLKRVQAKLQAVLPLDTFYVAMYEPASDTVVFPVMYDSGRFWEQGTQPLDRSGWVAQVVTTGQPVLINRTAAEIKVAEETRTRLGDTSRISASILMVPLPASDRNIGVISVQSYTPDTYNQKHLELLMAAGYQIATAVENARLYDSLQAELVRRRHLEAELQAYATQLESLVAERTIALARANDEMALVLNNTADALAFAAPNGDLLVTNPAFQALFSGAHAAQSLEHILWSLADKEQITRLSEALVETMQGGAVQQIEVRIRAEDGPVRAVHLTLTPVTSSEASTKQGVLLSGHDLTQMREIEQFKAQFLADAVHDLTAPILGLNTRLYLLKHNPDQLSDHIQALDNQVEHLRNLLEDLRTLFQLDRGQLALVRERYDVNELVRQLAQTYAPVASGQQQTLTLDLAGQLPRVLLDCRQLERVLVNLLVNAINYSGPHTTIHITTRILPDIPVVEIAVQDQGMGIAPEEIPLIFDRFYRTIEVRRSGIGGTGLGLAIAREIIELHGGAISVSSQRGHGSTFVVRLPV